MYHRVAADTECAPSNIGKKSEVLDKGRPGLNPDHRVCSRAGFTSLIGLAVLVAPGSIQRSETGSDFRCGPPQHPSR